MHQEDPDQAAAVAQLDNDDLVRFRLDEPISAFETEGGLSLTGGHHRTAEIIRWIESGRLSPDIVIKVLTHD